MKKRGNFFTIDAIFASLILVTAIVGASVFYVHELPRMDINYFSEDLIHVLSELTIGEVNDEYIQGLIAQGNITRINQSILETIGTLWVEGKTDMSRNITRLILQDIVPQAYSYSIMFEGTPVFTVNQTEVRSQQIYRKFISGIEQEKPVEGYSAKLFLNGFNSRYISSFVNFGGFVGEGNITKTLLLANNITRITDAYIETDAGTDFKLYVNGFFAGNYSKGSGGGGDMRPDMWNISNSTFPFFIKGQNEIKIVFQYIDNASTASGPNFIAGGFMRVTYETSSREEVGVNYTSNVTATRKIWLPGIEGIMNSYTSMYVPGELHSMMIHLHMSNDNTMELILGNVSVFKNETNLIDRHFYISNATIASALSGQGLSYSNISQMTIPMRLLTENVTGSTVPADIVLSTDISGSMGWCTATGNPPPCAGSDIIKLTAAKNASKTFVQRVLARAGPLIGLISYESSTNDGETHSLSEDTASLESTIDGYSAGGGTCICCGVNSAVALLMGTNNQSTVISRKTNGWRYEDSDLASPPAGWTTLAYNDASWHTGTTVFRTSYWWLGSPSTTPSKYVGDYYYRRKFNISDASKITDAKLYVLADNGARVYLNEELVDDHYNQENTGGASYWDRNGIDIDVSTLVDGENIIAARNYNRQQCSWWWGCYTTDTAFDLELVVTIQGEINATRTKSIMVMSDGEATAGCGMGGSDKEQAIEAACDAYNDHGITVHTVGFGTDADPATLQAMADCANGQYRSAANLDQLIEEYENLVDAIVSYSETQLANTSGGLHDDFYADSYIEINYTPVVEPLPYGMIPVTIQGNRFGNNESYGNLFLPNYVILSELEATSYSAAMWTDNVTVDNNVAFSNVFDLKRFGSNYIGLGDPFIVNIPVSTIVYGTNNTIWVRTATNPTNKSSGSEANRLLYTVRIKNTVGYSGVYPYSVGCNWSINFDDGSEESILVPSNYAGDKICYFTNATFNQSDAINWATYTLFQQLDFDGDGNLAVKIGDEHVEFDTVAIAAVPSMWGPSIIEARIWG